MRFYVLDRDDVCRMLQLHGDVCRRLLGPTQQRAFKEAKRFLLGVVVLVGSVVAILLSLFLPGAESRPLEGKVQTVQRALEELRGLESTLADVRNDLFQTMVATNALEHRNEMVKSVGELTAAQIEVFREALQSKPVWSTVFDHAIGFCLGVAASLVASIIVSRWRHKKSLRASSE